MTTYKLARNSSQRAHFEKNCSQFCFMTNEADAKQFLTVLFETKKQSNFILLWNGINKKSSWFQSAEDAAKFAAKQAATVGHNIYVGTALSEKDLGAKRRGVEAEVAAIAAFWIDIDFQDEVHKKKNLPADLNAAVELVRRFPTKPTYIIISGHGIQAWWIFDEVWNFADDSERSKAKELSMRFQRFFKAEAARDGLDVDSTFDLSRIYRVPGTVNYKRQPYKPVTIFEQNQKISRSELVAEIEKLPQLEETKKKLAPVQQTHIEPAEASSNGGKVYYTREGWLVDFVVTGDRELGSNKLDALLNLDPKIKRTYEHKRKEEADQSMSAYDFRLINFAIQYNWTNQEIVDLIITHRKKYEASLRLDETENYYARTIHNARTTQSEFAKKRQQFNTSAAEQSLEDNLEIVRNALNLKINRIERYTSTPPSFTIILDDETRIKVGDSEGLTIQRNLRRYVANVTKKMWREYKKNDWEGIAEKLLFLAQDVEAVGEATDVGSVKVRLLSYLILRLARDSGESFEERVLFNKPAVYKQKVHVSVDGFRQFIEQKYTERIKRSELSQLLVEVNCVHKTIPYRTSRTSSGNTSKQLYEIPDAIIAEFKDLIDAKVYEELFAESNEDESF